MRSPAVIGPPPHPARRSDERGAVAVELALVLPVLVTMLFGIIQYGAFYDAKLSVRAAVREASRAAALGETLSEVKATAKDAANGLDASKLSVTATYPTDCPLGLTNYAYVQVTYPYTIEVPFLPKKTVTIDSKSMMRCGG